MMHANRNARQTLLICGLKLQEVPVWTDQYNLNEIG